MNCRTCRRRTVDAAPGEHIICVVCGDISVVTDAGLREPTPSELEVIETTHEYRFAMTVIHEFDDAEILAREATAEN